MSLKSISLGGLMRTYRVKRSLQGACAVVLLSAVAAFADPAPTSGNSQTNASDRNFDTNQPNSIPGGAQKTEDGANRALNHVDSGVHKMARKTKHGAHRAKRKAEKAEDKMTEPAIKPAN